jgi:uncharacterized protein
LGVFAKVVRDRPVKTRLRLSRREAERFYVSSLSDTLETSLRVVEAPTLFLEGGEDAAAVADLHERMHALGFDSRLWRRFDVHVQRGADLGERLEAAFAQLCTAGASRGETPHPGFIIGSDSPSMDALMLERGLERLRIPAPEPAGFAPSRSAAAATASAVPVAPDVVLGPTADGGYWAIGVRRPFAGLLQGIAWSTSRAFEETVDRAWARGLGVQLLDTWMDVDRPEDLATLARQIVVLRERGDVLTARHTEAVLREMGSLDAATGSDQSTGR